MDETTIDMDLRRAVEFHGHLCPGLAIGYRIAGYVKKHHPRSEDEELVCIAENNSCSVDAIQALLGCTFGKGNLIYKDHGKQAFTFYSRGDKSSMRLYFKADLSSDMDDLRAKYFQGDLSEEEARQFERLRDDITEHIITAADSELITVSTSAVPEPEKARIYPSLRCQECGEGFMEICGRTAGGKVLCVDCFERIR